MKTVETLFSQTLAPTTSASALRAVPECSKCIVVARVANNYIAPTTPASIRVEIAYDTPPAIWVEVGRLNGGVQSNETFAKRVEIDPLAAHVRVTASSNIGAPVEVSALLASM